MQCKGLLVGLLVVFLACMLAVRKEQGLECEGDWLGGSPSPDATSPMEMQLNGRGSCVWTLGFGLVTQEEPLATWKAEYSGDWRHGRMEGEGTFLSPSGCTYEGEWRGDKRSGNGRFVLADGSSLEGVWVEDLLSCKHAVLALPRDSKDLFSHALVYMGPTKDSLPHGTGELRVVTPEGRVSLQSQFVAGALDSTGGWVDMGTGERLMVLEWREACSPFAACEGTATLFSPSSKTHYFLDLGDLEWVAKKSATTLQLQESRFEPVSEYSEEQLQEMENLRMLLESVRRFEAHFIKFQPQVQSAIYDFGNAFYEGEQERLRLEREREQEQEQEINGVSGEGGKKAASEEGAMLVDDVLPESIEKEGEPQ